MQISQTGLRWVWITVLVILFDRLTKMWVLKNLTLYETLKVVPHFNITLAYNKGAAFSFLHSADGRWQSWFFGTIAFIISFLIFIWLSRISSKQRWLAISLALIVGGALSNVLDRIIFGHVIDSLQVYTGDWYWPTFNIADSAVSVGAVMLLIDALFFKKTHSSLAQ